MRSSAMKKLGIILALLILLIGIGVLYLRSNLDSIVKAAIEKYGTEAAQTEVRLDNVKLSLEAGEGTITGLRVSNPHGFSSAKALGSGVISVKLDTSSIR